MLKGNQSTILSYIQKSVGLLLFVVCGIAIYYQVIANENWDQLKKIFYSQIISIQFLDWFFLISLMLMSILVEAIKWKIAVRDTNPIHLGTSLKSVFVGQAFAFFTPNRIGEYAGRTMFLSAGNKLMGLAQMAWTSYAQLLVTVFIGVIALFLNITLYPGININGLFWIKWLSPFIGFIAVVLYFYKRNWTAKFSFLNVLQIDQLLKIKLLCWSFCKYALFVAQYFYVAYLLKMEIELLTLFLSLAILFLCLSIVPTFSFSELVVRGQLFIVILTPFYSNKVSIVSLSSIIWGINFLIPSIIGTSLLLGYRIKR
jgi:hypothetical protein